MATQTQIEANRRNALHSTGPRSAEGKAASSMNAFKTGIDAEILIYMTEDTNYPSPNAPAGKAFHLSSTTQSRLQRRINDTSRLQREAIQDLQRLQAARPQPQPQPPAPQPAETESPEPPIGFVPQTHTPEPAPPLTPTPKNLPLAIEGSAPNGSAPVTISK